MKNINGIYTPSNTDVKRISAHCRAMARTRNYNGHVSAYVDTRDGEVIYEEFVGNGGYITGEYLTHVYTAQCRERTW